MATAEFTVLILPILLVFLLFDRCQTAPHMQRTSGKLLIAVFTFNLNTAYLHKDIILRVIFTVKMTTRSCICSG